VFNKNLSKTGELLLETPDQGVANYFMTQLTESGYKERERVHITDGRLIVFSNGILCFVFALIDKADLKLHRVFICGNHQGSWATDPDICCFFSDDPDN